MAVTEDDKAVKHGRERAQGTRDAESVAIAIRAITSISARLTTTILGLKLHHAHPSNRAVSGALHLVVPDLLHTNSYIYPVSYWQDIGQRHVRHRKGGRAYQDRQVLCL